MKKSGYADLPLHGGHVPKWLAERMALLMGIHKGLRYVFKTPAHGYEWLKKPNDAFAGQSALQIMLRGYLSDIRLIRDYLAAERGL